jgi:UDP-N-acetylmuramate--alanine ligase
MLARIVNDKNTIAVAGAHGKTTTSAMVYTVLEECGVDPSFIVGGELTGDQHECPPGKRRIFCG